MGRVAAVARQSRSVSFVSAAKLTCLAGRPDSGSSGRPVDSRSGETVAPDSSDGRIMCRSDGPDDPVMRLRIVSGGDVFDERLNRGDRSAVAPGAKCGTAASP